MYAIVKSLAFTVNEMGTISVLGRKMTQFDFSTFVCTGMGRDELGGQRII